MLLSGLLINISAAGLDGDFYVSPAGNDANNGSLNAPFKTLEKARDAVRTKKAGGMSKDIIVYIQDGVYYQNKTLTFGNQDSGEGNFRIIYKAFPGEKPVISGGKVISGFTMHDASKNIYKATVENGLRFRQLYVDGEKAVRSRFPNKNKDEYAQFMNPIDVTNTTTELSATLPLDGISDYQNLKDEGNFVELFLYQEFVASVFRFKTLNISNSSAKVTFQDTETYPSMGYMKYPRIGQGKNEFYWIENAYELIDSDNEWFLDVKNNTLYYKALEGMDMNSVQVVAPVLEKVVEVRGNGLNDFVKNITFEGLTFSHSTFMYPTDNGFIDHQGTQYIVPKTLPAKHDRMRNNYPNGEIRMTEGFRTFDRPPGGVHVENASYITFEKNMFRHLGATGLDIYNGTRHIKINGNIVKNVSGNGISVAKFWEDYMSDGTAYNPDLSTGEGCIDTEISNNYITRIGEDYMGALGIITGYGTELNIHNNEVYYMPYTGISEGYGWTNQINAMNDNKINYNFVHFTGQTMNDGAAIYTLSEQRKAEITGNLLTDTYRVWKHVRFNAIYLDEQSNGFTLKDNTFVNANTGVTYNGTAPLGHPSNKRADIKNVVINADGKTTNISGTICPDPNNPTKESTIYGAGITADYFDIENPRSILPLSINVAAGSDVKIQPINRSGYKVFLAPIGTTNFATGDFITVLSNTTGTDLYKTIKAPSKSGSYKIFVMDETGKVSAPSVNTVTVGDTNDASKFVSPDNNGVFSLGVKDALVKGYHILPGVEDRIFCWKDAVTPHISWNIDLKKAGAYKVLIDKQSYGPMTGKLDILQNGVVKKSLPLSLDASNHFEPISGGIFILYGMPVGKYEVRLSGLNMYLPSGAAGNCASHIKKVMLEPTEPVFQKVSEPMLAIDATPTAADGKTPPNIVKPTDGNPAYITNITSGAGAGAGAFWYANLDRQKVYDITVNFSRPTIAGSGDTKLILRVYNMSGDLVTNTSTDVTNKPENGLWFGPTTTSTADKDAPWVDQYCGTIDLSSLPIGNYRFDLVRLESSNGRIHIRSMQLTPQMPPLESIEAVTTKTQYVVGQKLDHSTITLTAKYTGESYVLSESEYQTTYDFSTPGNKSVTFIYGEKTTSLEFNVIPKAVEKIEITSPAIINNYQVGDTQIDLSEIVVMATYNDGDIQLVPIEELQASFDFSKEGQAEVTISFGGKSTSYFVNVVKSTGIKDINGAVAIKIYPNPSKGKIFISVNGINEKIDIQIHDITGSLIKNLKDIPTEALPEIPVSFENPGIYTLNIKGKDWSKSAKVIITK